MELAKRLEPACMFFVEDILPPEQIGWFRRIREVTTTPMAMGELFTHPHEWRPLIAGRRLDEHAPGGIRQFCARGGNRNVIQNMILDKISH
jgi:L-alanine-DL-glutamate epimerase-like enolase superfamily enzyme